MLASDKEMAIELKAALAVIESKREFARELQCEAVRVARSSGAGVVRLDHVRQAIPAAAQFALSFLAESSVLEQGNGVKARIAA